MARSDELQQWLDAQGEDIVRAENAARSMPEELAQELICEALTDDRIIDLNDRVNYLRKTSKKAWELVIISAYLKIPGVLSPARLDLKGMTEDLLPSSNIINTSALFGVAAQRGKNRRPVHHNLIVPSRRDVRIEYSGEQLYQSDWDVLHELLVMSRNALGRPCTVRPSELLRILGLPSNGHYYDFLERTVNRLRGAYLYVAVEGKNPMHLGKGPEGRYKASTGLNLIKEFIWIRCGSNSMLKFVIDHRIPRLFDNSEYGLVPRSKRRQLGCSELAKSIQALISGQMRNCQHHRMDKLLLLSSLKADMPHFTSLIVDAMKALIEAGVITAFWVSRPPNGHARDKILVIWKERGATPQEPIPTGAGMYGTSEGIRTISASAKSQQASETPRQSELF